MEAMCLRKLLGYNTVEIKRKNDHTNVILQQWSPPAPIETGKDKHYELTFSLNIPSKKPYNYLKITSVY